MPRGDGSTPSEYPYLVLPTHASSRNVVRRRRVKTSPCHRQELSTSPRAPGPPSLPPSHPQKVRHGGARRCWQGRRAASRSWVCPAVGACGVGLRGPFLPCRGHCMKPQGVTSALSPVDLKMEAGAWGHRLPLLHHPIDPEMGGCGPWGPAAGNFPPITPPRHAAGPRSLPHSSSLAPFSVSCCCAVTRTCGLGGSSGPAQPLLSPRTRQQQPGSVRHVHGLLSEPALPAQH